MDNKKKLTEQEIDHINQTQSDFFSGLIHVFEPPLPNGVPERLEEIVAAARIKDGETVLDVGTGTGILIPIIHTYRPKLIYACDLSTAMLDYLKEQFPFVQTITGDIRRLSLPESIVDVVFVNACFPNIVDKKGSISNMARMMKLGGRMVISHPMGKSFIDEIKQKSPFPLDDFPDKREAQMQFEPHGLDLEMFVDEPDFYLILLVKK
jgi:SAM-dependent methyltransferase